MTCSNAAEINCTVDLQLFQISPFGCMPVFGKRMVYFYGKTNHKLPKKENGNCVAFEQPVNSLIIGCTALPYPVLCLRTKYRLHTEPEVCNILVL